MGYIYKITNKVNNKIYIGQTRRTIEERWREHLSRISQKSNTYLYNAIRKYGKENFVIEKIEECQDDEIDKKEIFYIEKFESFNKEKGYNLTKGGDGNKKYDYILIRKLWDENYKISEIIKQIGCDKSVIHSALIEHETYNKHESLSRRNRKGINQYDLSGNFISHYNSIIDAAGGDKVKASLISACCNKKIKQALTYLWCFENEEPPKKLENIKYYKRAVAQFTLDGDFIAEFESGAAAARAIEPNKNSNTVASQILQVCKGQRKTARGFIWRYINEQRRG